jgi:hypothetical protein
MKNEESKSNNIIPVADFFKNVERCFHIKSRMVRLYIAQGLIPGPERDGKKSFYNLEKSKVWEHLEVVKRLQSLYRLPLGGTGGIGGGIGHLISNYRDQIVELNKKLAELERMYEQRKPSSTSIGPGISYMIVKERFLEKITKDVLYLKRLDLDDIEKEITGKST